MSNPAAASTRVRRGHRGIRIRAAGAACGALAVVLTALAQGATTADASRPPRRPHPSPTPIPRASPTATPTPSASGMKPPLVGVLDRSRQQQSQFDQVMGGWVVNVNWSEVQPTGTDELNTATIDQAIAAVDRVNAQGHTMGLKLRLFAGQWAPVWVKSLDGAPFTLTDPNSGASGTVGRWWTANYRTAYDHLQQLLAARYDTAPQLREVVISRCTSIYAEPMIRQGSDAASRAALIANGYSYQADEQCQRDSVIEHGVWQHTRSDLAFNPYQVVTASGMTIDETFTEQMMTVCRQALGIRCGVENNSLSDQRTSGQYPAMYAAMKSHAPGVTIQTATLARMTSLKATLEAAVNLGCTAVELPSGYQTSPLSLFQSIDAGLAANPAS